jgi:hypothetical protein
MPPPRQQLRQTTALVARELSEAADDATADTNQERAERERPAVCGDLHRDGGGTRGSPLSQARQRSR